MYETGSKQHLNILISYFVDFQWTAMVLSTIGKICVSAAFAVMFLYSGEIFPTVIRNSALGISAFFARIGGMVAPYIIDLVS